LEQVSAFIGIRKRKNAWLTPVAIAYVIANFNTIRIVSPSKSWRWFIGFQNS
jgi:hypothetical protein